MHPTLTSWGHKIAKTDTSIAVEEQGLQRQIKDRCKQCREGPVSWQLANVSPLTLFTGVGMLPPARAY